MASRLRIGKLVVIGVGLIGGSFALALKRARAVKHVVGVGRTRANLRAALELGVIDEAARDAAVAVRDADLVLLGTPVGQMEAVMTQIAPHLPLRAVVTDAGSTKQDVIACAQRTLGAHFSRFVPGHPIAGTERSGAAAAFPGLYENRNLILVPLPGTAPAALRLVRAAWAACGARIVRMTAREHDRMFAAVSHLPHVVAYALVNALARMPDARRLFSYSGGGLRDTVRIAGSSPEMWRDICMANRAALLEALGAYERELGRMRAAVETGDGAALGTMFEQARAAREKWLLGRRR